MTDDRSLERAARSWGEEGPTRAPDHAVAAALARIQTTPQERAPWVPWRLPSMNPIARLAALAVIAVVAIGGSFYLLGRGNFGFGSLASPAPSPTALPTPTAVGGPSDLPLGLVVVARNIEFDRDALRIQSGQPFTITLRNEDPIGILHDIDIRTTVGVTIQEQVPIDGGTQRTYEYAALEPGTYQFICAVHPIPGMTGTLTVR